MKPTFVLILALMLFIPQRAKSEAQVDSLTALQTFINDNPMCWSKEVVYEGSSILLCSDGEELLVQLIIRHPAVQMRMLMQGLTFYVDPTGKKKEKFSVVLPSANDVREQMQMLEQHSPDRDTTNMQQPDITPLLLSLSKYGAILDINGKSTFIDSENFAISLDMTDASLIYSVLVPVEQMLNEKKLSDEWCLGLYSQGGQQGEGGPGFADNPRPGGQQNGRRPPIDGSRQRPDDGNMRALLSKDIEEWIDFSFSEICSLNE